MNISKIEKARKKVGGAFKLTALIQKRIRELSKSGLMKEKNLSGTDTLIDKILDEVLEEQIYFEEPAKTKK